MHYSSDGKNVSVTHNYVKSTLVTHVTTKTGTGNYGYGKYVTITVSGKDNEGSNTLKTLISFNGNPKQMVYKISDSDSYVNGVVTFYANKATTTITGKGPMNKIVKATGVSPYRTIAGQKYLSNSTMNMVYYLNGTVFAKSTQFTTYQYKAFKGGFQYVKSICTTNSAYTVGSINRKSVINSYYTRNSVGTLTGLKVSGISKGTEKINNKTVSYTGKITISTRHDPKDYMDEGYVTGTYKEVRTSSSPVLNKEIPLDAVRVS